ncbi:MAG: hypothetical protein ICV66_07265 [Chitinophagaceae bacterium]|nr:hypothetical protein [Chitinophagaceae bacterium]
MQKNKVWFITGASRELIIKRSSSITELNNNLALETRFPLDILSSFIKSKILIKRAFLFFVLSILTHFAFAQKNDSISYIGHLTSVVSVTTKGISTIPSFTLGKPAVIFDLSIGTRRLSFEPQFRLALEGKPWSFLFWGRYKLLTTNKFQITLGAHPALNFRTQTVQINGVSREVIVARRYLAGELVPNISIAKNISLGTYYLYSRALEKDVARNTHFLGLRGNFSNIQLSNKYFMRLTPQFYYLKTDKPDGFYFTSTLTLVKRNFPFSLSSIINKTIQTDVPGSRDFLWNITLIYFFNKEYVELKQPL